MTSMLVVVAWYVPVSPSLFSPSLHRRSVHTRSSARALLLSAAAHRLLSRSLAGSTYRIVAIAVWVQAQSQLVVRLLDLLGAGVSLHSQHLWGCAAARLSAHTPQARCPTCRRRFSRARQSVYTRRSPALPPPARVALGVRALGVLTHCEGPYAAHRAVAGTRIAVRWPRACSRRRAAARARGPPTRSLMQALCTRRVGCGVVVCTWACGGVSRLVQ
jgi:hypothetical protein